MSIEFGIVEAIRRASDSTKGMPATMRRFWLEETVWALMPARYRNGGTNSRASVPDLATHETTTTINYLELTSYGEMPVRNTDSGAVGKSVKIVNYLTILLTLPSTY